jgi:hypothetical protein
MDQFDKDNRRWQYIWRCAMMRTSTREARYRRASQEAVMTAFVKEILRNGGRANWFAASLAAPVMDRLSTMPKMPEVLRPEEKGLKKDDPRLREISFGILSNGLSFAICMVVDY